MPAKIDSYTCSRTLGEGISAKVKLATTPEGQKVALKVFDKANPINTAEALITLQKEVDVYKNLNHPYMVKLIGFNAHATKVRGDGSKVPVAYMALELINGGELFYFIDLKAFS